LRVGVVRVLTDLQNLVADPVMRLGESLAGELRERLAQCAPAHLEVAAELALVGKPFPPCAGTDRLPELEHELRDGGAIG
jgi:hypothetical protein